LLISCGSAADSPSGTPGTFTEDGQLVLPTGVEFVDDLVVISDNNKFSVIDIDNPASNVLTNRWIDTLVYDTLVDCVAGKIVPSLAKSWETADSKHFTFKLRDDVVFHNGEKFTAKDVIYSFQRHQAAKGTQAYDNTKNIETMNAPDDYTIEFTTKDVDVDFLMELSNVYTSILNQKAIDADAEKGAWVGTGLWKIVGFASNDYVKFEVNSSYWGQATPTKKLTLKYVVEPSTRLIQLQNGEAQACFQLDQTDYQYAMADPAFRYETVTVNSSMYLAFNMNDKITGDINFRKAVAAVINRADMIQVAQAGFGEAPTDGSWWGIQTEFRNTDIPLIKQDIELAKEYLAKSSYKGEEVEIVAGNGDWVKHAQLAQAELQKIGVKIKIFQTDANGLFAYAKYDGNQAQMVAYVGPFSFSASSIKSFLYPGSVANRASYNNQEVAKLIDQATVTIDVVEREKLYKQIQQIEADELPFIYLYARTTVFIEDKNVGGVRLSADATHDISRIYMVKSK
jgi:peptide/nickel transport system substrate-binding protein